MRLRGLLIDLLLLLPWGQDSERYRRRKRRRYVARHGLQITAPRPPDRDEPLRFPASDDPRVSILVACYGNLPRVMDCLRSIARDPPTASYEVIVVDDCSHDPAIMELGQIDGLRFVRNGQNLGYLRSVNAAARLARGELLWLLNDDTLVMAGAANALVDTLARHPGPSAVGSLLLNADGSVQEAGSIVWRDGTASNSGASDPLDSANRYLHEADYCSAASLMLRRADFAALGGYDEAFAPAYYEDTDLAFRLRAAGGRVLMQPASRVVHLGGGSHGQETARALMANNRETFVRKWQAVLDANHYPPDRQSFAARDRTAAATLVLSHGEAGVEAARRIVADGAAVKLWIEDRAAAARLADTLGADGIEVISANAEETLARWLSQHAGALAGILLADEPAQSTRRSWERLAARHRLSLQTFTAGAR